MIAMNEVENIAAFHLVFEDAPIFRTKTPTSEHFQSECFVLYGESGFRIEFRYNERGQPKWFVTMCAEESEMDGGEKYFRTWILRFDNMSHEIRDLIQQELKGANHEMKFQSHTIYVIDYERGFDTTPEVLQSNHEYIEQHLRFKNRHVYFSEKISVPVVDRW